MHLKYGHWWAIKVLIIFKLLKRISFDQKERTKWQEGFDCLFGLNLLTLRGPYSRPSLFIQLGVLPINIAINYLLQLLCFLHFLGRKNVFTSSLACLLACLLSKLSDVTNTHHKLFFPFFILCTISPLPSPSSNHCQIAVQSFWWEDVLLMFRISTIRNHTHPVWPDLRLKSSPISTKSCPAILI